MVANSNFIANDYDLAFNMQNLFHEYVGMYTKLHYPDPKNALTNAERRELTLKLQESINDMALLAIRKKNFKLDAKIEKFPNHQTMSDSKRSSREVYN